MPNVRKVLIYSVLFLIVCACALATYFYYPESPKNVQVQRLSAYIGYEMWKEMQPYHNHLDFDSVVQGMKMHHDGTRLTQFMNEEEAIPLLQHYQAEVFDRQVGENLQRAEAFLSRIAIEANFVAIENGKVYYEVLQPGSGNTIDLHKPFIVHYIMKTLDDEEIANTRRHNQAALVNMSEVIPGFYKGMSGIKEGERRIIYVHPDRAYKKSGALVPPNSLVIIDVEVPNKVLQIERSELPFR